RNGQADLSILRPGKHIFTELAGGLYINSLNIGSGHLFFTTTSRDMEPSLDGSYPAIIQVRPNILGNGSTTIDSDKSSFIIFRNITQICDRHVSGFPYDP